MAEYVDHYAPVGPSTRGPPPAPRLLTSDEPTRFKERACDLCATAS